MSEHICGECRYHKGEYITNAFNGRRECRGFKCDNEDSEYFTEYTDYTDTCEEWSERGIE